MCIKVQREFGEEKQRTLCYTGPMNPITVWGYYWAGMLKLRSALQCGVSRTGGAHTSDLLHSVGSVGQGVLTLRSAPQCGISRSGGVHTSDMLHSVGSVGQVVLTPQICSTVWGH